LPAESELCGFLLIYPDDGAEEHLEIEDKGQTYLARGPALILEAIGTWLTPSRQLSVAGRC